MRYSLALAFVALTASLAAAEPSDAADQSPEPHLDQRFCLFGVCFGTTTLNYQTDVNNCGSAGNKCATGWANGSGAQCVSGVCYPGSCNTGYTLSTATRSCVNTVTDPNNCGSIGNVCAATNGLPGCSSGSCTIASCNAGYTLTTTYIWFGFLGSSTSCTAVNTASDVNNCGAIGKVCSFANGAGMCSSGTCTTTTCNGGFYLINGQCTTLNLATDVNNCGSVGNKCSFTNGVAECSSGTCSLASCNPGYTITTTSGLSTCYGLFSGTSSCTAVNTQSDVKNCGAVGKVCSFTNGAGTCSSGTCTYTSCNTGYYQIGGICTSLNLLADTKNCGAVGTACPTSLGTATCSAGTCKYSGCATGYTLSNGQCLMINTLTDTKNCGKVGNVCPSTYANGGSSSCVNGACVTSCESGYLFDTTYNFCRDVTCDTSNCGAIGNKCAVAGATAQVCSSGVCKATSCSTGFTLTSGACKTYDYSSDVKNCGSFGNACKFSPTGAAGVCSAGRCLITTCPTGYIVNNGACVLSASGRAHEKKSKIVKPKTLCPTGETACPIVGSTSFEGAVKQLSATETSDMMAGSGGYECIDTLQALDSCGGCAATGEGQDCTKIRGAAGVGCSAGTCVVFSCQTGYKPSLTGDRCVRIRSSHHGSGNHTTGAAKRHIASRHQSSGAFH